MIKARATLVAALVVALGCTDSGSVAAREQASDPRADVRTPAEIARADSVRKDSIDKARIVRVPTPDTLRGLYVNRWASLGRRMNELIEVAKTTEINSLVLDVKDDRGFVLYKSRVPLAGEIGADTNSVMSQK